MSVFATESRAAAFAVPLLAFSVLFGGCSMAGGRAPAPAAQPVAMTKPSVKATSLPAVAQKAPAAAAAEVEPAATPSKPARPAPAAPFDARRAGLAVSANGWRTRRRDKALVYEGRMRVPSIALFEATRGETLEETVAQLDTLIGGALGSVRVTGKPRETTLAGYRAFVAEGTGRAEGFPMRWRATVVEAERRTVVLGLAPSFFWGGNVGKIRQFESGIRKAAAPEAGVETASLPAARPELK